MDPNSATLKATDLDGSGVAGRLDDAVPNPERLVAEARELAANAAVAGGGSMSDLVGRYWRLVADEELVGRTAADMLAATRAHLELAGQRAARQTNLEIQRSSGYTCFLIVTDDMPFLVDSVTAAVSAAKLDVSLLVHPLMVVRRDANGVLTGVYPATEPDDAGDGQLVESWMRVEVTRLSNEDATQLGATIRRVLTDVRDAVVDWQSMRTTALNLADSLDATPRGAEGGAAAAGALPVPAKDIDDSVGLLRWLADDNFTFLGYREYRLTDGPNGENLLEAVAGTGLGILRRDPAGPRSLASMNPQAYERVRERRLLIITKTNARATVHRDAHLDYIGVKIFDARGDVVGERRFLGLLSATSGQVSVRELPVIQRKVAEVVERSGLPPRSHSGKQLLAILEGYPRDELFQTTTDDLFSTVMGVLRLSGRRRVRLFARKDPYGRFVSCLVYLPRDRYTTPNRLRIQEILARELHGIDIYYTTMVSESVLARLHFIVRVDPDSDIGDIDVDALNARIAEATRLWDGDFRMVLERRVGEVVARDLISRYAAGLPESYKDSHTAHEAAEDVTTLERLSQEQPLLVRLYHPREGSAEVRFKTFLYGEAIMLSDVLPVLHSLGVRVSDERPDEIRRTDAIIHIYDFGLTMPDGAPEPMTIKVNLEDAFVAAWRGESEVDHFNELVVLAGLTWRQVVILRTYARYLRQAGAVFSPEYLEATLTAHPRIAAQLVTLFEARLDPATKLSLAERVRLADAIVEGIHRQLDEVASLDQDRILRSYLALVRATLRTSFFQHGAEGSGQVMPAVAVKLDPRQVPDLPEPRPRYEIFVYSPRFEAVHLRFGPVARGGIRWSIRREDFRSEVLGLVKAQMVKNAVIVPVGAKGGFVLKRATAGREALAAEGLACYRQFISAMLDITDNLVGGTVVEPPDVVRHDGADPYLVVAADKGTATFSDTANEISRSYGFWLGDAFASGGSAGYDHKKMGITSRGAWESVKRHFREIGVDTQTQDFTVVGIGDMSGDVFGNAMLLSEHIRLVAAFDHRHIFVDPDPEPVRSYQQRRRLFDLPGSSWDDYDRTAISAGGGIWPRSARTIPISDQMRAAFGLDDAAVALNPNELIRAILCAPVDLLFNGGVGTFVKATDESHLEVGDKIDDAIRVNGAQLRVKVVGEGGNLGMTQRGRVEYARSGGSVVDGVRQARLCTDFIDNSAGVDCSDHEVNIKILLGGPVGEGELSMDDRNTLLEAMTDEVAALVLRDNRDQATTLGTSRAQAHALLPVHRRMISRMEQARQLDRELEAMPSDSELAARFGAGEGLTSPELAVLLAYTKIVLETEISESTLPDEGWTNRVLREYFPSQLRERFAARMATHPLRREIVSTAVVNEAVNRGGITFVFRAMEETRASAADVLRAYVVTRDVFDLPALWREIEALDPSTPTEAVTSLYLEVRRLADRAVRWLVTSRRSPIDVTAEIDRLRPGVTALMADVGELFRGREREALYAQVERVAQKGVPRRIADWATRMTYAFGLLDIVEVARNTGQELVDVAGVYFALSEHLNIDFLQSKISGLSMEDRWRTLARMALRYDLYAALAALTREVLLAAGDVVGADNRVDHWERGLATDVERTRQAIQEFSETRSDLASLSVVLRQIRTLVRTSAS